MRISNVRNELSYKTKPVLHEGGIINYDEHMSFFASHGYVVIDGLLPTPVISQLNQEVEELHEYNILEHAKVFSLTEEDGAIDATIRGDSVLWLDPNDTTAAQAVYFQSMEAIRCKMNEVFDLDLKHLDCHFAQYDVGAFFTKHLDRYSDTDNSDNDESQRLRIVSSILYLNDASWQDSHGGHLRVYQDSVVEEDFFDISPYGNRLVLFLSDKVVHEVLPTQKMRRSLTGWFCS